MYKIPVTYTNYNDVEVTEEVYFNLNKKEAVELLYTDGDFETWARNLLASGDVNRIMREFEAFILKAYGRKSEDGTRFMKSDAIREDFMMSAAWDVLYFDLISSEEKIIAFIRGVFPKDFQSSVTDEQLAAVRSNLPDNLPTIGARRVATDG